MLSSRTMQRLWLHRSLALALFGMTVTGCREARHDDSVANAANNESKRALPLPIAEPPLDRKQLLLAVLQAASASALGQDDSKQQRALDGARFEVRLRFGCPVYERLGSGSGSFDVRFDEEKRTLRVSTAPDITLDDPRIAELSGSEVEAAEGFWLPHPWLLTEGCPPAPPQAAVEAQDVEAENKAARANQSANRAQVVAAPPASGPAQQIGIAQFFTEADSRTTRREQRPYAVTKGLAEGEQPSAQGYNLVLSGRLRPAQGKVINCRSTAPDRPPDCVVSAQFDRVFIERPDTKEVLGEWTS